MPVLKVCFLIVAVTVTAVQSVSALVVSEAELRVSQDWVAKKFTGDASDFPFSFQYNGEPSREFIGSWSRSASKQRLDDSRTRQLLTLTDPHTALQVRCEVIEYHDFPTSEWTLYFKNTGNSETPIISEILPLDIRFARGAIGEFALHHNKGSRASIDDYRPYETILNHRTQLRLSSMGGRPTNGSMPFFNLQWPEIGAIVVIGWSGQYQADFHRDDGVGLHVTGGQPGTHFKLHPGEEVRTPLIVVQHYHGDRIRAQNIWRRWMVKHSLPRPGGELPPTQLVACSSHQFAEMINANEENQKSFIDRYLEEKLPIRYWWMDAGWYKNDGTWINTGTWEVDTKRFPRGLRAITDHARQKGLRCIVWFEPERVTQNSWIFQNHPDWVLTPPPNPGDQLYDAKWRLLNLGNKDALSWLIDHVGNTIEEQGIGLYRQDFNLDPLLFWQKNDSADRQGISEINYVTGYLAYWDALRKRFPDMLIDTCASGGRRNDLETLRRAVPLVRSDHLFEPVSQQSHHYGIAQWIPYHGTGTHIGQSAIGQHSSTSSVEYAFRSHMACSVTACWDMRSKDLDYDKLRRLTSQLTAAAPNFLGDFYPLTEYSTDKDAWMAWQYNRPEQGEGVFQAFRREVNMEASRVFKLHGLDPNANYTVDNVDVVGKYTRTGADLMEDGLLVHLPSPSSAALIFVRKE